ncbi:MAG: phosphoribosylamine--glycine ligase [Pseudomonadota bacterium]
MKVLVIGNGGREHALAWRVAQSETVSEVFVAPGNAGTQLEPGITNVAIAADNIDALAEFASNNSVALTIVGPEAPLVAGIVDDFSARGLPCFGPTQAGAQLEGSKKFTKEFLARHNIPTAAYASFNTVEPALAYVRELGAPLVVKADGLAAGKGVVVATTVAEAEAAVNDMLGAGRFGDAGATIVIEEFLEGEEASFIVMCDGKNVLPLASSQDHKARDEGDKGPNTGGMGAYSPTPLVSAVLSARIMDEVIYPTMAGLASEGINYTGFLYAGLMIGADGVPKVLEFNCRFGDPETQPIMVRLQSDLADLCLKAIAGELDTATVAWDPRPAVGVVLAARGYPDSYAKDEPISGLKKAQSLGAKVFHAGTRLDEDRLLSAGGRVLCVVASGDTVTDASENAYLAVDAIDWPGGFCRRDIAWRALEREKA